MQHGMKAQLHFSAQKPLRSKQPAGSAGTSGVSGAHPCLFSHCAIGHGDPVFQLVLQTLRTARLLGGWLA